jgi:hypothetical protein
MKISPLVMLVVHELSRIIGDARRIAARQLSIAHPHSLSVTFTTIGENSTVANGAREVNEE